jgi:hypothetical protein
MEPEKPLVAKSLAADQKAKVKKQKVILAVGGVLLLGLVAFQAPKMMAMLSAKPPSLPPGAVVQPPNGFATPPGGAPLAAPSLAGSNGASGAVATRGGIVDSSALTAVPASGQLVSFGRFASKDPFAQQVDTSSGGGTPSSGGSGGATTPKPVPPVGPLGPSPGTPAVKPLPTTASISVNGIVETVGLGIDFPVAAPVFHLVALTATSAKIAIVGGSYADGAATVTLKKGKTLTLENTSDGSRYVLRLIALDPVASTTTTTTTTTPTSTTALTP